MVKESYKEIFHSPTRASSDVIVRMEYFILRFSSCALMVSAQKYTVDILSYVTLLILHEL